MVAVPVREKGAVTGDRSAWWASMVDEAEETLELRWPDSVKVYDRMRRQDPQVMSVLRAVKLPIQRTAWRLDGTGCDPAVTAFVAGELGLPILGQDPTPVLRTRDRFSWAEHLRLALLKLDYGHSVFEQTYRLDGDRVRLRKLGWRPPRTIAGFEVARDGGLVAVKQRVDGLKDVEIPVSQLVVYVQDREGGNWAGTALLRPAYKPWLLKDDALRTQAMTLKRNGLGVPLYTAGPDPADLDLDAARAQVEAELEAGSKLATEWRAGDESGAAIRNGAKLELNGVKGELPDADKPIRYHDEQIARAVLAHFLNLGTETGSWALGSTFADFFTLSLQTVALDVADTATMHIVEDLVDLNFGETVPAPRVVFDEIGSRHPATAEAIKLLVDAGVIERDDDLERYMRTIHGLPAKGDPRSLTPVPPVPPVRPVHPEGPPHQPARPRQEAVA